MNDLIALDSCILIAGIHLKHTRPRHPCAVVVSLAERRVFRTLLIDDVEVEVRRGLSGYDKADALDTFIAHARIERCLSPSKAEIDKHGRTFLTKMRYGNDVPIAISLMLTRNRPYAFVSTNSQHWNSSLAPLLAGIRVMSAKQFLAEMRGSSGRMDEIEGVH